MAECIQEITATNYGKDRDEDMEILYILGLLFGPKQFIHGTIAASYLLTHA